MFEEFLYSYITYSILNTKLNDRTFEESGNYAINPFILDIREDYNDGSNFGRSTSGSATKFNVGIGKNIA